MNPNPERYQTAVSALQQIAWYADINHANFKDYGEVAKAALKKMKEKEKHGC